MGTGTTERRPRRVPPPRWAKWCAVLGTLLMLGSGGALITSQVLVARYSGAVQNADLLPDDVGAPQRKSDIEGPLNILLVGIDQRPNEPTSLPRADSILILHLPAGLDRGYLVSLPRDLLVDIPAYDKAGYAGGHDKINAAMAFGSRVPGQRRPSTQQGFALLAKTVSRYTGIKGFDAAAIISFVGFQKIVDAMGGVDLYVDTYVKSEHRKPDGSMRKLKPGGGGYLGPQAEYKVGMHHLSGWQALDYVRQRYGLPNGDYDRQRHQQQFIKAMISQAFSKDVVTNPVKLDRVLRAAGESVIFDGQGHNVVDYAFALKNIRSDSIVTLKLPGDSVFKGKSYQGERLLPPTQEYFAAVRDNRVEQFVVAHPEMVTK
ncbi:MAG: LCP family protein [Micromonosporaceae bacterium]|nr:LCP family protein [Micromonosporaceae bacterium]